MNKLYIYGAGMLGKKILNIMVEQGHQVMGFIDSFKTGKVLIGNVEYPILTPDEMKQDKDVYVVVSVADPATRKEMLENLKRLGLQDKAVEEVLYSELPSVERNRKLIADYHVNQMDDYFDIAEDEKALDMFWGENSPFRKMFERLDLAGIIELACGHGRHVAMYKDKASNIILVDVLKKNIDICKERYKEDDKIHYYINNGHDLSKIPDKVMTSLFTYDSMVHFELIDIYNYLKETKRVLKDGGMALFHHSNNTEHYKINFATGRHGRNYMSAGIFAHLADRAGLEVVEQQIIDWDNCKSLDCITLVRNNRE